ncbi:MAG: MMPL family transporter [bacterium]|nr:MMPL family transporter [bacterium]
MRKFTLEKFANWVIRFRYWIILATVLITVASGYSARKLTINSDLTAFLPRHDPVAELFKEVDKTFQGADLCVIALETGGIFDYATLAEIQEITDAIEKIPGIASVISLTNIIDIRKIEDGIEVGKLIDPDNIPRDPQVLSRLKEYTLSKDMYSGVIISRDGKSTLILARILVDADEVVIAGQIEDAIGKITSRPQSLIKKPYYAGFPFQMRYIDKIIKTDFLGLTPITIFAVMFVLFLSFRTLRGIFLPILTVLFATVWTLGLIHALGREMNMLSSVIPVLLIACGSAYGIHVVNRYYNEVKTSEDKIPGLIQMAKQITVPVFLAALTTQIGFGTFVYASMPPVQETGLFIAAGIGFAFLIAVTFIPASLAVLKVRTAPVKKPGESRMATLVYNFFARFSSFPVKYRWPIIVICIIIALVSISGLPRLTREVNFVEYFKPDSPVRVAENFTREAFGGSQPLLVDVRGDILNPFVLKEMRRMSQYLDTITYVCNPQSVADLIMEANYQLNGRYSIPDTAEGVSNLFLFLEGNEFVDLLVKRGNQEALIQTTLSTYNTKQQLFSVAELQKYFKDHTVGKTKVVDLERLDPATREKVMVNQLDMIGENIVNLVKATAKKQGNPEKMEGSSSLSPKVREILASGTNQPFAGLDQPQKERLSVSLREYLVSPQSEIEIKDGKFIDSMVVAAIGTISNGASDPSRVESALIPLFKAKKIKTSPETISSLTRSLSNRIQEKLNAEEIDLLGQQIIALLPAQFKTDHNFAKYLQGYLWEIHDRRVALPEKFPLGSAPVESEISALFQETGGPVMFNKLYPELVNNMMQSIFLALFLVLILMIIQFKSFQGGLIAMAPISLTVLTNFGIMSYFGVPVDDTTMMVSSIGIGIGIDYTIHFTSRFREELEKTQGNISRALEQTFETTGRAILINAISVTMGFIVLVFSSIVPTQRFGWLLALLMVISSVGSLTLLPALLLSTKMKFIKK